MPVEITVRHSDVSEDVRELAERVGWRICEEYPGVEFVHVILDKQRGKNMAELAAQGRNRIRVDARSTAADMKAALEKAFEKLERQLRKAYERRRDRHVAMKHAEAKRRKGADN